MENPQTKINILFTFHYLPLIKLELLCSVISLAKIYKYSRPITADKKTSNMFTIESFIKKYYKLPVKKKHSEHQLFRKIKRKDCLYFFLCMYKKTIRMRIFSFISSKLEIYWVKWEIPFHHK